MKRTMNTLRIVLIEDDALLASLLTDWIRQRVGWTMVGHAVNGVDGIRLCREVPCDLALIDVAMPVMDGLAVADLLRGEMPALKLIALTCHSDPYTIQRVLALRLDGYISKTSSLALLEKGILQVMAGGKFYDDRFMQSTRQLQNAHAFHKILSQREVSVLGLVAEGHPDVVIGKRLSISPFTVAAHRRNMRVKLDAHNDRDLIQYARQWGLVKPDAGSLPPPATPVAAGAT